MIIGLPREIKAGERRVALTPQAVATLVAAGTEVRVESGAGIGAGFADSAWAAAGAEIVGSAGRAWDADLVVKVKEVQTDEWRHVRPQGIVFAFLHLGGDPAMARQLLDRRVTGIAFETVRDRERLAILAPMSRIAGELCGPVAAQLLTTPAGGCGILLSDAKVLVIGAGSVGLAAARACAALGAQVTVTAPSPRGFAALSDWPQVRCVQAEQADIARLARENDVVIGAVNIPGSATPKLLGIEDIAAMSRGSVLIEVCIDGGGISATSRPTTLDAPTYFEHGVVHWAVPNMPAAVPRSATRALSDAVLPYVQRILQLGLLGALREDAGLLAGLQLFGGEVTHPAVAQQLGMDCLDVDARLFAC